MKKEFGKDYQVLIDTVPIREEPDRVHMIVDAITPHYSPDC